MPLKWLDRYTPVDMVLSPEVSQREPQKFADVIAKTLPSTDT